METKETIKGSESIAKFMGLFGKDICPIHGVERHIFKQSIHEHEGNVAYTLKYHSSYDWSLYVVEKIEEMGWTVTIKKNTCRIFNPKTGMQFDTFESDKKTAVFEAIFLFSRWYNKNN